MPNRNVLIILAGLLTAPPFSVQAEPTPRQAAYWWQDELREVAFSWSQAQTGSVAQWPRMTVPAGAITMPLPEATGPIQVDGKLDEPAWQHATSFPVGPVFDDWGSGPFVLQLLACRDKKHVYLAVESPRDLTGLGALTPAGELFTVQGKPYSGSGHIVELALPLTGKITLTVPAEMVRRTNGKLAPEYSALGIDQLVLPGTSRDHRKPWLWLQPMTVRLVPSPTAVRTSWEIIDRKRIRLESEVRQAGAETHSVDTIASATADSAVFPYSLKPIAQNAEFVARGFFYVEPINEALAAAREMLERSDATGSAKPGPPSAKRIAALEAELKALSPKKRDSWRAMYCKTRELRALTHLSLLDAPLLFVKQHPYFAAHIYDDYYTWRPGGGISVRKAPHDPADQHSRTLIDPSTEETLGEGVYRDAELSWEADRVLFAFKGEDGNTSIYEIRMDGRNLRRVTDPGCDCEHLPAEVTHLPGHHDITPIYLPDERIAFTSTRPQALVPCFNSRVDTLHVADADGSNVRSISSNNVNEFDPAVLPDGRILYGRWEYVDKTALYMQSLWTVRPDGRMEEALFGNNLAKPTAILDARAVPDSHLIVASLTPHNGQAVGAIGMIDTAKGKNDLEAVFNFTPEYPIEMDQGLRTGPCDPWALSPDDVLMSNNAIGSHSIIELTDRRGHRELVQCDPTISCFAPMLVKPRRRPTIVSPVDSEGTWGRFLLVDIYQGLKGVERGSIKKLRIVEETARISGLPPGGRWWNQAFLVSWQGAYIVKNFLGTVPVHEDGSAHFEVPAGRAVYFEALDAEGREIQRMRTFVQAVPGTTRSCIGCHENKKTAAVRTGQPPLAMLEEPARPGPESWGSGYIDYPTMVQPILDQHCVRCHGGEEGIAKGLDLSGGWTWAFNISYETLIKHRLIGFLNCHNSSVHTSEVLPPRTAGSGAAPLAEKLITRYTQLPRRDRDLILAWMDTNSDYFGTWDYTQYATCNAILKTAGPLSAIMQSAGCVKCHKPGHIGNDWVNLQTPEWSRILRAPMAKTKGGLGVAMCRDRKARNGYPLVTQQVQPPDVLKESLQPPWDDSGDAHIVWTSTDNKHYQAMLAIIRQARAEALAQPRVDMPGAEIVAGECRRQVPMPVPAEPPKLAAQLRDDSAVVLSWPRTAETIGLKYALYRGPSSELTLDESTEIARTTAGQFVDLVPPVGTQHYGLVVASEEELSRPAFASLKIPQPSLPDAPSGVTIRSLPGEVALTWQGPTVPGLCYDVYRTTSEASETVKLNAEPLRQLSYMDLAVTPGVEYAYTVRTLDRRSQQSPPSKTARGAPLPEIQEPVFATDFRSAVTARLLDGKAVKGVAHGGAKPVDGVLEFGSAGFATFKHVPEFEIRKAFTLECWVRIDQEAQMPVIVAAGAFNSSGWFLQRYGRGWRWHLAPVSCDGGRPVVGQWTHLVGTFDGRRACLYQDGKQVGSVDGEPNGAGWKGGLVLGQYTGHGAPYQVMGGLKGVRVYHRALRAAEVAERFQAGR